MQSFGDGLSMNSQSQLVHPLIGGKARIERELLGTVVSNESILIREQWDLDEKLKKAALTKGYDLIVLMSPNAFSAFKASGKLPQRRAVWMTSGNVSHL
jgi:hypothetical protein